MIPCLWRAVCHEAIGLGWLGGWGLSEDVVMAIGGGVPDRGGAWLACCASVISMYVVLLD
jgi:hypothetical protein